MKEATRHNIVLKTNGLEELPIYDTDIEETVLACIIHDREAREHISKITEEDFYHLEHKKIFMEIKAIIKKNKEFDEHTASIELKHNQIFLNITNKTVTLKSFDRYLEKLKDISARREFQGLLYGTEVRLKEGKDLGWIKTDFQQKMEKIDMSSLRKMSAQNDEIDEEFFELINSSDNECIKTGYWSLDEVIGGLYPGRLYLIGGLPGVGKTTFMLNILNFICKKGKKVLLVTLEMSCLDIQTKLVSELTGISNEKIRGCKDVNLVSEFTNASFKISKYNLSRMGETGASINDIENEIKNLEGVDILFIDYLQKLKPNNMSASRYEQITQISKDLKSLTLKYKIPVVAVASVNRKFIERQNKRPALSDFRDSGNMEFDVDVAFMLYRESQLGELESEEKKEIDKFNNSIEIILAKNRYGRSNISFVLLWKPEKSKIEEVD